MPGHKPAVLVLTSTFPRWAGDTDPRFVYDLCQRLKDHFDIWVLAPHCRGAARRETLDGLHVVRYHYAPERWETLAYDGGIVARLKQNRLNYALLPFFLWGQLHAIRTLLRQQPIDVIHAHWIIPQGALALLARVLNRCKPYLLCTSHGSDLQGLNDPLSHRIQRWVITKTDALTVVSRALGDTARQIDPSTARPIVAPMGTDLQSTFTPDPSVPRDTHRLLFVGRLVQSKGVDHLLTALLQIRQQFPETRLDIAGSGPEQATLERFTQTHGLTASVRFLGHLTHQQLVQHYRRASVAVFPFIREGLGLVVIEAQGCGCPVVASDIPAIRDSVKPSRTGLLAKPGSPADLARQVCQLLAAPEQAARLAQAGRQHACQTFDWPVAARQYQQVFNTLLRQPP